MTTNTENDLAQDLLDTINSADCLPEETKEQFRGTLSAYQNGDAPFNVSLSVGDYIIRLDNRIGEGGVSVKTIRESTAVYETYTAEDLVQIAGVASLAIRLQNLVSGRTLNMSAATLALMEETYALQRAMNEALATDKARKAGVVCSFPSISPATSKRFAGVTRQRGRRIYSFVESESGSGLDLVRSV